MTINNFLVIDNFYKDELDRLIKQYPRMDTSYVVSCIPMNIVEKMAWIELKQLGLPFLPQLPVGRFYPDFCDPVKKIIIEIDGKDWHEVEKDRKRDIELNNLGYTVHRFKAYLVSQELEEDVIDEFKEKLLKLKKENYS